MLHFKKNNLLRMLNKHETTLIINIKHIYVTLNIIFSVLICVLMSVGFTFTLIMVEVSHIWILVILLRVWNMILQQKKCKSQVTSPWRMFTAWNVKAELTSALQIYRWREVINKMGKAFLFQLSFVYNQVFFVNSIMIIHFFLNILGDLLMAMYQL